MSTSLREAESQSAKAIAHGLRSQIVRANSWSQLFESNDEERADFESFIQQAIDEYGLTDKPERHIITSDPEGDIHTLVRNGIDSTITYQKLVNGGNVIIRRSYNGRDIPGLINCVAGNIRHPFTKMDVSSSRRSVLEGINREEAIKITDQSPAALNFFLRGKAATIGWENMMLSTGYMPQRIGHRIFPSFALEAQAKLMAELPNLYTR